jgi:hypothetical protein
MDDLRSKDFLEMECNTNIIPIRLPRDLAPFLSHFQANSLKD